MTTYRVVFNIPAGTTGSASQYRQIFLQNSSNSYTAGTTNKNPYMPDSTIYIKRGDTIKVEPDNTAEEDDVRQALSASESEPDPTSPTSWPVVDGTEHILQWPSNATDLETRWYYFGGPTTVVNGATEFTRSGHVRINAVKIDSVTVSNSGQVASTGGTLTVAITGLAGLLAASGNNGNRLFVHVRNSSGTLITSNVSFSTAANNAYLGRFSTSTTSCTLTVGASLAQGNYTIRVGHFGGNGAGSGDTGNPFYGTDHSFSQTGSFTKNPPAADTSPNAFQDSVFPTNIDYTGRTPSTVTLTEIVQLSGTNAAAPISVSGTGSPEYRTASTQGGVSSATFVSNSGNIDADHFFQMRYTTNASYGTNNSVTPVLTIGSGGGAQTATKQVSNAAAASGGTSSGQTGTVDYGLRVFNGSGNDIYGVAARTTHLIKTGVITVNTSGVTITGLEGFSSASSNLDTHLLILSPEGTSTNHLIAQGTITVTRGTNQATVSGSTGNTNFRYYAIRY